MNDNLTKDGSRIICEWTNTRLVSPDGASVSILCMAQDVTSRKQAEEALKRKTEELEAFNKAMIGRESRVIELKEGDEPALRGIGPAASLSAGLEPRQRVNGTLQHRCEE